MGQQNQAGDLIKSALIGGVLGGIAALLLAPKSGRELREDIADITGTIKETGRKIAHPFEQAEETESNGNSALLIGGAVGAVIGALAALLLAPKSGAELREALGDSYEGIREKAEEYVTDLNSKRQSAMEQVNDWKDTLTTLVNKLSKSKSKKSHFQLDEILEWAGLGLNLFQQYQKRR